MTTSPLSLWPKTPPSGNPNDHFSPYLEPALHPGSGRRGIVLVFPGGGYSRRAPHEGMPVAERFNQSGFHAAVLQYRVAPNRHPAPLLDAARAIRLLRKNADAWNIRPDQIAVLGFSAGGHLAGSITTMHAGVPVVPEDDCSHLSCRPDAAILCYPVISSDRFGHRGSFDNLLGSDSSQDERNALSLEHRVDANTPKTFLWHTAEDSCVPVENSLAFAAGLRKYKIPFELHVYPDGNHGVGLAIDKPHVATWADLASEWLHGMGW